MKNKTIGTMFFLVFLAVLLGQGAALHGGEKKKDCAEDQWSGGAAEREDLRSLTGTIVRIDRMERSHGVRLGMHLTLKTVNKAERVHLCRACELEKRGMKLRKNDLIEVRGEFREVCGNQEFFALEITRDGHTIKFKDLSDNTAAPGENKQGKYP